MANTLRRVTAFKALWQAITASRRGGPSLGQRLAAVPRMIRAIMKGDYDGGKQLLLMSAAAVYLASPVDLVPEAFLMLLGLVDDAVVVTWLAGSVLAETERFIEWESKRKPIVTGNLAH